MKKVKWWKVLLSVVTIGIIASKAKIIRGTVGGALENVDPEAVKKVGENI